METRTGGIKNKSTSKDEIIKRLKKIEKVKMLGNPWDVVKELLGEIRKLRMELER